MQQKKLLAEKQNANRHQRKAERLYNEIEGMENFGVRALHILRAVCDAVCVVFAAYVLHFGVTAAGNDEAAGKQLVTCALQDRIAFARDERFIHFRFALQNDGVGADLLPGRKMQHIVHHNPAHGYRPQFSVAQHRSLRCGNEGELVNRPFRSYALKRTDNNIRKDNAQK